jgi:CYTH domain-containing protein
MPTENELKFVLLLDTEEQYKKLAHHKVFIHQGYLVASKGISLRCRKVENKKVNYYLTLKSSVNGRVVEIENNIDERDFNDLWSQCMNKLEKVRYVVMDGKDQEWEIDFFKDYNSNNYFCLAELEMPEGQEKPKTIPNFIKENLVYEVSLTDCRFSSKLLADVRYATKTYNQLKETMQ